MTHGSQDSPCAWILDLRSDPICSNTVILGNEDSIIHVNADVDTLRPAGKKLAPLFRVLRNLVHPSMMILPNLVGSLPTSPRKSYYSRAKPLWYDLSSFDFSNTGPKAFFSDMPLSKCLIMNLDDVPELCLDEPVIAVHDLENKLLGNLGVLQAVFELEAHILTGSCSQRSGSSPRPSIHSRNYDITTPLDTLVMTNLDCWLELETAETSSDSFSANIFHSLYSVITATSYVLVVLRIFYIILLGRQGPEIKLVQGSEAARNSSLNETVIGLLPSEKGCEPGGFLLKLLKARALFKMSESARR